MQNTPSLEEAKVYIDSIDFSMVIDKIIMTKSWKKKDVLKICEYYKNFLFLNKKYGSETCQLPPSDEVDEFWHNHILDTHKYTKDCDVIFGRYLHHYPYFGIDDKSNMQDLQKAFDHMQELHKKEFGDHIYRVRSIGILVFFKTCGQIVKEFFVRK